MIDVEPGIYTVDIVSKEEATDSVPKVDLANIV